VILIDANLLLYAYHERAEQHDTSRAWLEAALSGPELVRFASRTLWAFLRIGTNPRVFEHPLSTSEAEAVVSSWLSQPAAGILEPGDRHWDILRGLIREGQTTGPLLMDAVIAAIAPGTRRHPLHNGPRLLTVSRAQMDESASRSRLTPRTLCFAQTIASETSICLSARSETAC
jgi:toxin-antitoxin system PIN domain toxin